MIPVLLGAAAIWGISNFEESERKTNEANRINQEAAKIADSAHNQVKDSHEKMTNTLTQLGKTKKFLMDGNITTIGDIVGKIYKNVKIDRDTKGLRELEEGGITEIGLGELRELGQKSVEIADAAHNINTDDNHGWAALGALGGAALGFGVIAAPALLLYSIMESDKADEALYNAKTQLDKAKVYEERCKNINVLFTAITTRGRQIDNLLGRLNYYFDSAVSQLQQVRRMDGYEYRNYPPEHKAVVFYSWQIAQTVKTIIDTSMINEDLSLNSDIERPLEIGNQTLKLLSDAN